MAKPKTIIVYKSVQKSSSRGVVAIKCLRKALLSASGKDNLISEISALKKLHHPHIVAMHDFRWDSTYIYIIMEHCAGGDLASYLKKCRLVPEKDARNFLQQLAQALSYMHYHHISHLDLKPSNILLTTLPSLKIADFGFAQHWRGETRAEDIRGSLLYMAPEMVVSGCYDDKADLWSVGVILYECLFGQAPFMSPSLAQLRAKIKSDQPIQIPLDPPTSPECKHLLEGLLVRDPVHRSTFPHFIHHPFLHPPSPHHQAKTLVSRASQFHKEGDFQASFDAYCEAVQCYLDAIKGEKNERRKDDLRIQVNEYIEEAEEIKTILKSQQHTQAPQQHPQAPQQHPLAPQQQQSHSQQHFSSNHMSPIEELSILWQDSQQMTEALRVIKSAQAKLEMEEYKSSLERYEMAIGVMLKLVKDEPASRRKELLHSQISKWLSKAGSVKKCLMLSRAKMADDDDDISNKTSCVLQ